MSIKDLLHGVSHIVTSQRSCHYLLQSVGVSTDHLLLSGKAIYPSLEPNKPALSTDYYSCAAASRRHSISKRPTGRPVRVEVEATTGGPRRRRVMRWEGTGVARKGRARQQAPIPLNFAHVASVFGLPGRTFLQVRSPASPSPSNKPLHPGRAARPLSA